MKKILHFFLTSILLLSCNNDDERFKNAPILVKDFEEANGSNEIDLNQRFDVVVYGGTTAGIIAAIEVKKSGKSVLLIHPIGTALGGMTTNGLGITDVNNTSVLGGLTRGFYQDIKKFYSNPGVWFTGGASDYARYSYNGDVMIWFEPKAAKSVLLDYINKYQIPILHNQRLELNKKVKKNANNSITEIQMESGMIIKGKMYIDATYEGDLMAKSGVKYTIGRESTSTYNEFSNGVQRMYTGDRNQFPDGVKSSSINYNLSVPSNGTADNKIQAYNFRMCLTDFALNKVDIEKPIGYNENDYELLFEYVKVYNGKTFFDLMPLPNRKTDSNNFGPISTDYVGENYKYPDGNYQVREQIIENHKRYQQGLLWTLANHPNIPEEIRNFYKKWGLPKDEFISNNHWPRQLYIREGRRMIGEYVMTENNCTGRLISEKSIGMGEYPMDSHIVQRYIDNNGNIKNEGHTMAGVPKPYPIDYGTITPKKSECSNLFVPVCLSASHIAYGSIRMEPIFMNLGQVSAIAAILSIDKKIKIQDVKYEDLRIELQKKNIVF